MNPIQIMPMGVHDLSDVVTIESDSFKNPWGMLAFINELACESAYSFVLKSKQSRVIAYFCFRLVFRELHVLKVAVSQNYRQKGMASSFFGQCLKEIPGAFNFAFLEVRPSNMAAMRLYEKLGFQIIGKRPGYYTDTGEDAIMMGKIFKGGSNECKNSD